MILNNNPSKFLNKCNSKKGSWKQGVFTPKFPNKCIGNMFPTYRSSWEQKIFTFMDENKNVEKWGSEILKIPYKCQLDNKVHTYFVDIFALIRDNNGNLQKYAIEIKPFTQTQPPKPPKKMSIKANKNYLYSIHTYTKNTDKWNALQNYCAANQIIFKIITEDNFSFK